MHHHVRHSHISNQSRHVAIGKSPTYIVDDGSSCRDRFLSHFCTHRVNTEHGVVIGQGSQHGQYPSFFFLRGDARGSWAGGFTANVDNVHTFANHLNAAHHCTLCARIFAAIREGIGCDVDDAHHQRALGFVEKLWQPKDAHGYFPSANCIASARVAGSRSCPRTALVTVRAVDLRTPRIDMQRCSQSIITITPSGSRMRTRASAI